MFNVKTAFASVVVLGAIFLSSFLGVGAANTRNLSGHAWSENIGWISFNSKNCDTNNDGILDMLPSGCREGRVSSDFSVKTYGVKYNNTTNNLFGYAWSSNIGWVYFGPDVSGDRTIINGPTTSGGQAVEPKIWAKVDTANSNKLKGWARACMVFANASDCANNADSTSYKSNISLGGWDGWISMSSLGRTTSVDYGVRIRNLNTDTSPKFEGYAWGGGNLPFTIPGATFASNKSPQFPGWISFKGVGYGVYFGDPDPGVLRVIGCTVNPGGSPNAALENQPVNVEANVEGGSGSSSYVFAWTIKTATDATDSIVDPTLRRVQATFHRPGQAVLGVNVRAGDSVAPADCAVAPAACFADCIVPVTSTAPDFSLVGNPTAVSASFIANTQSITKPSVKITVIPYNSFDKNVALTLVGIYDNTGTRIDNGNLVNVTTTSFTPVNLDDTKYSSGSIFYLDISKITGRTLPSGIYTIRINGTNSDYGLVRSLNITLNIDAVSTGYIEI